jgi:hypothetical protein
MFAFFDDIDEAGLYSFYSDDAPTPSTKLLTADAKKKLQDLRHVLEASESAVREKRSKTEEGFSSWLEARPEVLSLSGETARFQAANLTDKKLTNLLDPSKPVPITAENKAVEGRTHLSAAIELSGNDELTLPAGNFLRSDPFTISLWIQTPDVKERAVILHRSKAWTDSASRGYELLLEEGRLKWSLIRFWPGDAASVRCTTPLEPGPLDAGLDHLRWLRTSQRTSDFYRRQTFSSRGPQGQSLQRH